MCKLSSFSQRVIPVISYLSENPSLNRITYEVSEYRKTFPRVAFRIKTQDFENIFSHVENLITEKDTFY